jgi:hypothetical protein
MTKKTTYIDFKGVSKKYGVSVYRMSKETGVSYGTFLNNQKNAANILQVINKVVEMTGCSLDELIKVK